MIPPIFRFPALLIAIATLAACAPMTPVECKNANWRDVGLRDGLAGARLSQLDDRTKACAEAGVQADAQLYLQGRNQGLQSYCRIENAPRVGLAGQPYHGVCAPAFDAEFRRRWQLGHDVYALRGALRGQESRSESLERRLRDADGNDERRKIREELSDLDRNMRRTRDRLRDAEYTLDRLR